MLAVLTAWCAKHINKPEAIDTILNSLQLSIERGERFLALVGRELTTDRKPYLVQRYSEHLFIDELDDDTARGYDLQGGRLRCGSFPPVAGFERRPENALLYVIKRFDARVKRTGITERKVSCELSWTSAGTILGGGMGVLFTSNYGGNDASMLMQLPPQLATPNGKLALDITLEGLEFVDRGASLFAEVVQLGGNGLPPSIVSPPVLQVLCV